MNYLIDGNTMRIKATLIGLLAAIFMVAYSQAYYMHEAAEDAGYRPHDSPLLGILTYFFCGNAIGRNHGVLGI